MTKIKIALAALLLAGTASTSFATEFDPNLANRYPGFSGSHGRVFQSAPVRLNPGQKFVPQAPVNRQSLPHAGGVG